MTNRTAFIAAVVLLLSLISTAQAQWKPAASPLMTRWADDVSPDNSLREYPRPQMERKDWTNLNGLWKYAITSVDAATPDQWQGDILVPFAVESALSGVGKKVGPYKALWYQREFAAPPVDEERWLLHFGAVDWHTKVWVNGTLIGEHRGGFDPFSFDITHALKIEGPNRITVRVWDPSDAGTQPRGKQVLQPGGIHYTSVTGIWQTVWLEPVPKAHIRSLRIRPDVDGSLVEVSIAAAAGEKFHVDVKANGEIVAQGGGRVDETARIKIPSAKLWSPDSPHLYDLVVRLDNTDEVQSYVGMRKIEFKRDEAGRNRMFLNNKPLFQYGPLDQGWWPDGLLTAPTDEALRYDIEITKEMGFNMARKHVKVEPARWYYWADKLGLLVWQDMPSLMARGQPQQVQPQQAEDVALAAQAEMQYHVELKAMIDALHNHPCIVVWVSVQRRLGATQNQRGAEVDHGL